MSLLLPLRAAGGAASAAYLAGKRLWPKKKVKHKKGAFVEDEETRTAVHEAGHALVAWRATRVHTVTAAWLHKTGGNVGYQVRAVDGKYETELIIRLAGIAAEIMVFGNTRSLPSRSDLSYARAALDDVDEKWLDEPEGKVPTFFSKAYEPALSETEERKLQRAYLMARKVLDKHSASHSHMVCHLLSCKRLETKNLDAIFGSRAFMFVLSEGKRLFL